MEHPKSRLIVKNLPPDLDERSLREVFAHFGSVTDCRIMFAGERNRRFGFVGFRDASSAQKAVAALHQSFLGKGRISVELAAPQRESRTPAVPPTEELDPLRLYLTNLPFNVDEAELLAELSHSGRPTSVRLLKGAEGHSQGRGFVTYASEADALRHLSLLDGGVLLGRLLRAQRCRKFESDTRQAARQQAVIAAEPSTLKRLSKQKLLSRVAQPSSWSAVFLNPNLVLQRIAERIGTTRKGLLAASEQFPALAQTMAEKEVLDETLEFLRLNGLEPAVFDAPPAATPRSDSAIIVKNLPLDTTHQEIEGLFRRYGEVTRTLLAPNRALALVWFSRADHARNAFSLLGVYKLRGTPLYLEWAPALVSEGQSEDRLEKRPLRSESQLTSVLVLKNLDFAARNEDIESLLRQRGIKEWRSVKIPRRGEKSAGYGFVEFATEREATSAQRALHGELLHGRLVEPLFSKSHRDSGPSVPETTTLAKTDKILLKNIAFNATKNEIEELVGALVRFKKVRMPLKADGSNRGYVFVEFDSPNSCETALAELRHLHFYGRRLVAEFAQQ